MEAAGESKATGQELAPLRRIALLTALGASAYAAFEGLARLTGWSLPGSLQVGVPFLAVPVVFYLWKKLPLAFGPIDRGFALSAAAYAPFAAWIALAEPGSPATFRALAASAVSFPLALLWAVDTFLHVGAVDYFTRRVVQREAETLWGVRRAFLVGWGAWCGGHVVEWLWLRALLGDLGAAAFLALAGLATGAAFVRWKNAGGLMAGHFLVNAVAAAVAVALFL